ncbi:MAG: hypothetical protein HOY69_19990 [Streptomyces sp.]|nr:hypothetical protein [Streptomyces sp.]
MTTISANSRGTATAVVLAAALALLGGGCGTQGGSGRGDVPPTATGSSRGSGDEASVGKVVYFDAAPRGWGGGKKVLGDRAAAERYAAAFAEDDPQAGARIASVVRGTDFTRQVLVGWTAATGCSTATAAALHVSGNRLELHVSQPKPPPECVRSYLVSVLFQVPRERMPAHPEFA